MRLRLLIALVVLLGLTSPSVSAQMILLHDAGLSSAEHITVQQLTSFYGLDLHVFDVQSAASLKSALNRVNDPRILAVLTTQSALSRVGREVLLRAMHRRNGSDVPLLIFGIDAGGDESVLRAFSAQAIERCTPLRDASRPAMLSVENAPELTGSLAGLQLPAVFAPACHFQFASDRRAESVLVARGSDENADAVLVRVQAGAGEVFFLPSMKSFDQSWVGKPGSLPQAFSAVAPLVFFLLHAAGDRAWHTDGHFANLTIDDPWLTQPFGHLDYDALLAQMTRHNFHTTIAFIPWNFDRSTPEAVKLFREHPERFSISVHGNNHDHREFGEYADHPLSQQIGNVKQSLARMERLHQLTGIDYDRVMVFPHAEAPEKTFAALKLYGYLATSNANNVPLGGAFPTAPTFLLRPYTVRYANFLSMARYQVGGDPRLHIALQSYLGNPLLFYGHENTFGQGITAFNETADLVNKIEPATRWVGLGEIARHMYLIRRHEDGVGFAVQMLSTETDITNPDAKDAAFDVEREEDSPSTVSSVFVDGTSVSFMRASNAIRIRALIPGRQTRRVRVVYSNDLNLQSESASKGSLHVLLLRKVSDFRDLYLTRSRIGSALMRAYYQRDWYVAELYVERNWPLILTFVLFCSVVFFCRRANRSKQRKLKA